MGIVSLLGADTATPQQTHAGELRMQHAAVQPDALQRQAAGDQQIAKPAQQLVGILGKPTNLQQPIGRRQRRRRVGKGRYHVHGPAIIQMAAGPVKAPMTGVFLGLKAWGA